MKDDAVAVVTSYLGAAIRTEAPSVSAQAYGAAPSTDHTLDVSA